MKNIFKIVYIIGVLIICILSFTVPTNPNEILPPFPLSGITIPIWLCGICGGSIIYLIISASIYDKIQQKK